MTDLSHLRLLDASEDAQERAGGAVETVAKALCELEGTLWSKCTSPGPYRAKARVMIHALLSLARPLDGAAVDAMAKSFYETAFNAADGFDDLPEARKAAWREMTVCAFDWFARET